jgi:hypothetical protein
MHPMSDLPKLTGLSDSLQPVKERFNQNKHQWRFITLLSPT